MTGPPAGIFWTWDEENKESDMAVAATVAEGEVEGEPQDDEDRQEDPDQATFHGRFALGPARFLERRALSERAG